MEFIILYCIVAVIFAVFLDCLAMSNIGLGDTEYDELMSNFIMRTFTIFIISFGWIITLPIMIVKNRRV